MRYALRTLVLLLVLSPLVVFPQTANAHPMDMYAQEQSIHLTRDGVQVEWRITPGPLLAAKVWDAADQDKNGSISQAEAMAWFQPMLPLWKVEVRGQQRVLLQVQSIDWPKSFDNLQSGNEAIVVDLAGTWPQDSTGSVPLNVHNTFQESISLNWFSVRGDEGLTFEEPKQENGQLSTTIRFQGTTNGSPGSSGPQLTSWESGMPSVPGLTGTITDLATNLAGTGQAQGQASVIAGPTAALVDLIKSARFSPLFLIGAMLLSIALGALHALTPGHGKTLVAAYLVGSHGRVRDAVFLGWVVTITHTGSVLLLGLVTLIASRYILPTLITPYLEIVSGLFIVGFGLNLLIKRTHGLLYRFTAQRDEKYARRRRQAQRMGTGYLAAAPVEPVSLPGYRAHGIHDPYAERELAHDLDPHLGHDHSHDHDFHHHDHHEDSFHHHDHGHLIHQTAGHHGHPHSHVLPDNQVTWKSLLSLGVSGGLVPCPDAIAILLVAVTVNKIPFGMLLIVAFSIGLALVLIAIGIAMVQGFRLLSRHELVNRFSLYSPLASAVVVSALGIGLTWTAVRSFSPSAALSQPIAAVSVNSSVPSSGGSAGGLLAVPPSQAFDLTGARLLYMAPDADNHDQLFVVPVSGGDPVQLTKEPYGILGYKVPPDRKSIVYWVLNADGESAIWSVDLGGESRQRLLDCPKARCVGPVWSPEPDKLFYERMEYGQSATLSIYSIWWLDMITGDTQPVFQDPAFPSFAPRFSPDGQWMSYISPSTNSLQVYSLKGAAGHSIPYWSSIPQIWSPMSDALLLWDYVGDQNSIIHVELFDLASGKTTDLGASLDQQDYLAAWSPDGKSIAVVRDAAPSAGLQGGEQIDLIRRDGSGTRTLLADANVSLSNLSWSPDGRYVIFSRTSNEDLTTTAIWTIDVATGQGQKMSVLGDSPTLLP